MVRRGNSVGGLDSDRFISSSSLIHDVNSRPKYKDLLLLPFLMCYESKPVNVPGWLKGALKLAGLPSHQR